MVAAKKLVCGLMIIAMSVALVGCGGDSAGMVLDDADSGKTVLIDSGDQFEVRLESNASTGFEWVVDPESASDVVTLVSSTYDEPETDLVGAPGTQVFVFEATVSGAGILRLEYLRPFDDPPVPERIVELIVSVDDVPWTPSTEQPPTTSTATAPTPEPVGP
jgi:inhibitor of cysteine peptidase